MIPGRNWWLSWSERCYCQLSNPQNAFWTGTIIFLYGKWKQNSNNTLPLYESVFVMMIPGRNWQSSCSEHWRCQLSEPRNGVLCRGPSFYMRKRRQNSRMELQKVIIRRRMLMQRDDSIAETDIGRGTQRARERERERERERMFREGERERRR